MGGMGGPVVAIVAAQQGLSGFVAVVIGQGNIAIGTFQNVAATATGDEGAVTAPMDKEQALLAQFGQLTQRRLERSAEEGTVAFSQFLPHVDDAHGGQGTGLNALGQGEVEGGRWRCRSRVGSAQQLT